MKTYKKLTAYYFECVNATPTSHYMDPSSSMVNEMLSFVLYDR